MDEESHEFPLPEELISIVLSHLPVQERCLAAAVSRTWRRAVAEEPRSKSISLRLGPSAGARSACDGLGRALAPESSMLGPAEACALLQTALCSRLEEVRVALYLCGPLQHDVAALVALLSALPPPLARLAFENRSRHSSLLATLWGLLEGNTALQARLAAAGEGGAAAAGAARWFCFAACLPALRELALLDGDGRPAFVFLERTRAARNTRPAHPTLERVEAFFRPQALHEMRAGMPALRAVAGVDHMCLHHDGWPRLYAGLALRDAVVRYEAVGDPRSPLDVRRLGPLLAALAAAPSPSLVLTRCPLLGPWPAALPLPPLARLALRGCQLDAGFLRWLARGPLPALRELELLVSEPDQLRCTGGDLAAALRAAPAGARVRLLIDWRSMWACGEGKYPWTPADFDPLIAAAGPAREIAVRLNAAWLRSAAGRRLDPPALAALIAAAGASGAALRHFELALPGGLRRLLPRPGEDRPPVDLRPFQRAYAAYRRKRERALRAADATCEGVWALSVAEHTHGAA